MSDKALSQTKFLDLADPMFETTTPESMERLITKCAGSLERVIYSMWPIEIVTYYPSPDYRIELLSKFQCPRLVYLDLGGARIDNGVLRDLLVNCPNLRHFCCERPSNTDFPVTCESMEGVFVRSCEIGFLRSLTSQCPNLKSLVLVATNRKVGLPSEQILDEMLAKVPNLETLALHLVGRSSPPYDCANMGNFLKLHSLRSLDLKCRGITDQSLQKISESLGRLKRLRVRDCTDDNASLTSNGVGALSKLEKLRDFSFMRGPGRARPSIDDGIQLLASRGRLRQASFKGEMVSEETMVAFVQRCPNLSKLRVSDVQEIGSPADALRMLGKFAGFQQQNVAIYIASQRVDWNSDELKGALDEINASAGGRRIEIHEWDVAFSFVGTSTGPDGISSDESGDSVSAMEADEETGED